MCSKKTPAKSFQKRCEIIYGTQERLLCIGSFLAKVKIQTTVYNEPLLVKTDPLVNAVSLETSKIPFLPRLETQNCPIEQDENENLANVSTNVIFNNKTLCSLFFITYSLFKMIRFLSKPVTDLQLDKQSEWKHKHFTNHFKGFKKIKNSWLFEFSDVYTQFSFYTSATLCELLIPKTFLILEKLETSITCRIALFKANVLCCCIVTR